ncbi:MAG: hypothetical protein R3B70_15240 [Polyangiaceae bacterium]
MHLRVACTADELVAGCAGGGPRWRWLPREPQLPALSDRELLTAIIGDLLPADTAVASATPPAPSALTAAPQTATQAPPPQDTSPAIQADDTAE